MVGNMVHVRLNILPAIVRILIIISWNRELPPSERYRIGKHARSQTYKLHEEEGIIATGRRAV